VDIAQDREHLKTLVNIVMKTLGSIKGGQISQLAENIIASQGLYSME
jgi:hypothetical protein